MRDYSIYKMKNGIRVVHHRVLASKIVHCGIMLDIGSRDETHVNQGIAHFWEHMAFKGTRKRNAFYILNRLESLGGDLNAFTDKEKIFFFASLRDEYFERAVELLADITFNSVFPVTQIERERNVILEEMAMYYDDPEDSLQDEFDNIIFKHHALGMNILGSEATVKSFRRKEFQAFIRENLDTGKIIFSCVGNVAFDVVVKLAEKYMGAVQKKTSTRVRKKFAGYAPREKSLIRDVKQARCAIGRTAYKFSDARRLPFFMLTNILGGPGMNSRLNAILREKHGLVYSVAAQFIPFTDTGLFVVSFGTEISQMDKSIRLVNLELTKLMETPLGARQLSSAKEQFMGQIAMAEENNIGFMIMMARNLLDQGRIPALEEVFTGIRETSASDLTELAGEIFAGDKLSRLIMQPKPHGIN